MSKKEDSFGNEKSAVSKAVGWTERAFLGLIDGVFISAGQDAVGNETEDL